MFIQLSRLTSIEKLDSQVSRSMFMAIFLGLVLGSLFKITRPDMPDLASLAMWTISFAAGLLGASVFSSQRNGATLWGFVIGGQLLGAIGISLIIIASLT